MNEDNQMLWVSPTGSDEERGTIDQPFGDIDSALTRAMPGQQIVLMDGVYTGNVTIQKSGDSHHPIRIVSAQGASVVIDKASWFLYDVSDMIIEGLTFRNSGGTALSAVGACERNRFANLRFVDCGLTDNATCTLFFGGTGSRCNIIESCEFTRSRPDPADKGSIALLVVEGDSDGGTANKDFLIRKNAISNYGHALLVGSRDSTKGQHGHVVEYNRISSCTESGIMVRCGDTIVRGNTLHAIGREGISVLAGVSSMVVDNRITECTTGIRIAGTGHTVANNCLVGCNVAIHVAGKIREDIEPATALIIERNTIVNKGAPAAAVAIDAGTSCISEHNLVHGTPKPFELLGEEPAAAKPAPGARVLPRLFAKDNALSGCTVEVDGFKVVGADFSAFEAGDFTNHTGYGAEGWVLTPAPFEPDTTAAESMAELSHVTEDLDIEEPEPAEEIDDQDTPIDLQGLFITGEDDPSPDEEP